MVLFSRTGLVCLILTLAVSSIDVEGAAKRRQDLQWSSPQSAPVVSGPSASSPAGETYSGAIPSSAAPYGGASVQGEGGNLPGGPYGVTGRPYYYQPQGYDPAGNFSGADPYTLHFGPGYYRRAEYGHHRFPYYSYRRPWYHPGHTSYNRDTNYPW